MVAPLALLFGAAIVFLVVFCVSGGRTAFSAGLLPTGFLRLAGALVLFVAVTGCHNQDFQVTAQIASHNGEVRCRGKQMIHCFCFGMIF